MATRLAVSRAGTRSKTMTSFARAWRYRPRTKATQKQRVALKRARRRLARRLAMKDRGAEPRLNERDVV